MSFAEAPKTATLPHVPPLRVKTGSKKPWGRWLVIATCPLTILNSMFDLFLVPFDQLRYIPWYFVARFVACLVTFLSTSFMLAVLESPLQVI